MRAKSHSESVDDRLLIWSDRIRRAALAQLAFEAAEDMAPSQRLWLVSPSRRFDDAIAEVLGEFQLEVSMDHEKFKKEHAKKGDEAAANEKGLLNKAKARARVEHEVLVAGLKVELEQAKAQHDIAVQIADERLAATLAGLDADAAQG
jgi:hypothetical protein